MSLALLAVVLAQPPAEPKPLNPELRAELQARVKKDQDVRAKLIRETSARGLTGNQLPADVLKEMQAVDADNRAWLGMVVDTHGWPGKSLVGADGAHDAWLMVQHTDRAFQARCLPLLAAAVQAGEATAADLAYLTDRVRTREGKKQVYGTQLKEVGGRFVPEPVEDEADLDQRRKAVGLKPMAEYLKAAAEQYMLKPKPNVAGELTAMAGTWKPVSAENNGFKASEADLKDTRRTLDADGKWTMRRGDKTVLEWKVKTLDPTKTPKQLDIEVASGEHKGVVYLAIYELDGDRLRICFAMPDKPVRPTEFTAGKGSVRALSEFKRVKE